VEHIIANLLKDFEQGRMTRRQLIQSLALTATAASAVGAASATPAEAAEAPFKIITVNHISYQVADYKKTRDFYADLFGLKATGDKGNQCDMAFGDQGSWLLPRNARQGTTPPKVDHIAYTIADWDKDRVKAELDKRGLNPRPDTDNSFHIKDPDGFDVQISGKGMTPSTT
jgi:catechol 2,3-dioxygenase-like lactoylglutathione lyase family enzyme